LKNNSQLKFIYPYL